MNETDTFLHGCKKLRSFKRIHKEKLLPSFSCENATSLKREAAISPSSTNQVNGLLIFKNRNRFHLGKKQI